MHGPAASIPARCRKNVNGMGKDLSNIILAIHRASPRCGQKRRRLASFAWPAWQAGGLSGAAFRRLVVSPWRDDPGGCRAEAPVRCRCPRVAGAGCL